MRVSSLLCLNMTSSNKQFYSFIVNKLFPDEPIRGRFFSCKAELSLLASFPRVDE